MRKKIFGALAAAIFFFNAPVSAEIKTFHEENAYIMQADEPIKIAQDKIFKDTVRKISESVNLYISSSSQMKNSNLTEDKIESFSAAILKIKSKKFTKEYTPDNALKIIVTVDAEMDTDNVAELFSEILDARNANKNYDEILTEYTKRKNTFDTVYGDYLNSYQKRILQTIREGCELQRVRKFDEALKLYNTAIDATISEGAELSLAYIKRGTVYGWQDKTKLSLEDFNRALELNNDPVGVHFAKGFLFLAQGDKIQAANEFRNFVQDANIIYYDTEIRIALEQIVKLNPEEVN